MQALGIAGAGETPRIAPGGGGGNAGCGHDIRDRQEAPLGQQVPHDFSALSLAHGPSPFPLDRLFGQTMPLAPRSVNHVRSSFAHHKAHSGNDLDHLAIVSGTIDQNRSKSAEERPMSGPASGLDAPLPDLWDAGHAAKLSRAGSAALSLQSARRRPAHHQLRRRQHLGQDRRRDPLTGETVKVLWVKGSGGDLGSMKLDGFATLYLDKLVGLKRLYRGPEHEDEMVGSAPTAPSTSIRAPPRSIRRCMASCRIPMSITCIPTRSSPSPPRGTPKR